MDTEKKKALLVICNRLNGIAKELDKLGYDDQDLGATIRNIVGAIVNTEVSEMYLKIRGKK